MKHKKILFVCTGNTCRSPMAEAALRAELKKRRIAWFTVQSAGLSAREGSPVSPSAAQALKGAKIPLSSKFKSRRLTDKMIRDAHVVICMTEAQRLAIPPRENVTDFKELCGREIPDPYGEDEEVYRATLNVLIACAPLIIEKYVKQETVS